MSGIAPMTNDSRQPPAEPAGCQCGGSRCCCGPRKWIWIVLGAAILGVLIAKHAGKKDVAASTPTSNVAPAVVEASGTPGVPDPAGQVKTIPRLIDLGATKCIPCKMMAPILEDLKKNYAGKLDVQFIDVWENPAAGKKYGINMIPTQIFFDAAGKELFRHEGFFGKEEILGKWKEFGVDLAAN